MLKPTLASSLLAISLLSGLAQAEVTVPERLKTADKIVYCGGMDSPPMGFFDEKQKPVGIVVELGDEIARHLGGKRVEWQVTPFAGLIPALMARHCDMIVDQLFDKPERREVIDIVNYMYSSQAVTVLKGNPADIHSLDDLSGKRVAVLNGSTIRTLLEAHNEVLNKAGKAPMTLVVFNSDTDAFQALRVGQADAYGTTMETAGYYQSAAPDLFEVGVPAFDKILTGFGIRKEDTELSEAVSQALADMKADGSYMALLSKWHIEGNKLD
ncbi:Lysine-arginine-ornithine-binding periplasmic protein precursor [Pseudomonas sp. THAF187a]|uniref:ABC transporter substrate-binding protein n=1 Tax=Pseudomonadaceae TaxID=135621 RepID=UPI00126805A3|nr:MULTISPECIES: ABC transporter substrate-binding protein [unclassified Pseudomonas]QFT24454.1 Lysine-arginine-ornithine-binding periplasmic protein precursor [Pseudomonas sp. THAF187a]QFT44641.1 Lysine-arginine-ornithine-binding periplasmic protein precursor [Pseudomonas sp. THAF42]